MAVKCPMEALINWQRYLFSYMYGSSKIRLFSNNLTPGSATVFGDFTECTYAGYASVATGGWTNPAVDDGSGHALSTANPAIFTPTTTSGNVYGWYLTNNGNTEFYVCERFSGAPINFSNAAPLALTIGITEKSEF